MTKYRKIHVSYCLTLIVDVDGALYQICGETDDGKLESIEIVDVSWFGGAKKIEDHIRRFKDQGIPITLDWFAARFWGHLINTGS